MPCARARSFPARHPIRFDARGATMADGEYIELDLVIMATGFLPVLHHYLDIDMQYSKDTYYPEVGCDWDIGPNGVRGWPLRELSARIPTGGRRWGMRDYIWWASFTRGAAPSTT